MPENPAHINVSGQIGLIINVPPYLIFTKILGQMKKIKNHQKGPSRRSLTVEETVDILAHAIVSRMSPLELGKMIYPDAEPIDLASVTEPVIADHFTRYTEKELKAGQFFRIGDKYTFFMDHEAKKARNH